MQRRDRNYRPLNFLLDYASRIKDFEDKRNQRLFLHIAFAYLDQSDYDNALKHFLKSVQFNPESDLLKVIINNYIIGICKLYSYKIFKN